MAHSRKISRLQIFREEIQLVDLQAQIARLYFRVVPHIERDDTFDQRRKALSTRDALLFYIGLIISRSFSTDTRLSIRNM